MEIRAWQFKINCYFFNLPDKLLLFCFWWGRGGAYAGLEGPPEAVASEEAMEAKAGTLESRDLMGLGTRFEIRNGWTAV